MPQSKAKRRSGIIIVIFRGVARVIDTQDVHFTVLFEHLSDLLLVLITLDELFRSQTLLHEHWSQYKRMLKSVRHAPEKFSLKEDKIRPFEKLLMKLEGKLLDGVIFQASRDVMRLLSNGGCL